MYAGILQEFPQVTATQKCMSTIQNKSYRIIITQSSPIHERSRR